MRKRIAMIKRTLKAIHSYRSLKSMIQELTGFRSIDSTSKKPRMISQFLDSIYRLNNNPIINVMYSVAVTLSSTAKLSATAVAGSTSP